MVQEETLNKDNSSTEPEELTENQPVEEQIGISEEPTQEAAPLSRDQEIQDLKDKYLRLLAEFENYKKRTAKERIDFSKFASQDLIVALLPVLDDFDREVKYGLATAGSTLIHNKLFQLLKQKGLVEMDSTGMNFDPSMHEAVTELPVDEDQKNKIIDTVEKGYYLSEKIIRYAKVVVGK